MEKMNSENCGPGCDCGKPSGNTKVKFVACLIAILVVGGILVYKAIAKNASSAAPSNTDTGFTAPLAIQNSEPGSTIAPGIDTSSTSGTAVSAGQGAAVPGADSQQVVIMETSKKQIGDFLDSLGSLNKVAANQDAVFIFLPAKADATVTKETDKAVEAAKKTLESKNVRIGLYTLQSSAPEYTNIAAQLTLPGMLVLSKGRGMGAVSGEITEEKLLQAYVASSRAGGCGPSGCGPSGCGPSPSPSCK
jgi:hypothetical protein